MEKQVIISIGREFGSGGHEMAVKIAQELGLPLYDWNLLRNIANEKNVDATELERYDELPNHFFTVRTVRGHSSSLQENIAQMQFEYIKKKADEGESFVVVGRCSEYILRHNPHAITLFVLGDMDVKTERIMRLYGVNKEEAKKIILDTNRRRKLYHNYYTKFTWGDSRNYELSINSSKLGIADTTELVMAYVHKRIAEMD